MRIVMCVLAATLAFGCKKKASPAAGTTEAGSAGSGGSGDSGSAMTADAAGSGAPALGKTGRDGPTVIVLPKLSPEEAAKPPHPTKTPVDKATYEKLAALAYPGFQQQTNVLNDNLLEVRYLTDTYPRLAVTIRMFHCPTTAGGANQNTCDPMKEDVWAAKRPAILASMPGGLAQAADTVVEIGSVDVGGGKQGIYVYQVGFNVGSKVQGEGAYSNAYTLHWNDGVNQLYVAAEYKDDPTATLKDMTTVAPKVDLARLARSFFDVYTHAWQ